jgi:hypothetical protein
MQILARVLYNRSKLMSLKVDVQNGSSGGFPRKWNGHSVAVLDVDPDEKVSTFLERVTALNLRTRGGIL